MIFKDNKNIDAFHEDIFEKCILCGCTTDVSKDTPVENRKNYISGCGQLCEHCFMQIELL